MYTFHCEILLKRKSRGHIKYVCFVLIRTPRESERHTNSNYVLTQLGVT